MYDRLKRLQYLRSNQTKLRAEVYSELQDLILADGEPDQIGQRVILPNLT